MYEEPGILYEMMWVAVPAAVVGLLVGLGIFAGVYFAVSLVLKRGIETRNPPSQDASEVVRERYARGEISRKEYEQMREDLGH